MKTARELQIEIFRSWTPAQRLAAAGRMIDLALALRAAAREPGSKAERQVTDSDPCDFTDPLWIASSSENPEAKAAWLQCVRESVEEQASRFEA